VKLALRLSNDDVGTGWQVGRGLNETQWLGHGWGSVAARGARSAMAVRSLARGEADAGAIRATYPDAQI
jgi:hypothetical protein